MQEKIKEVSDECYQDMSNTSYPRGVFFVKRRGMFIGVDNKNGQVDDKQFRHADECLAWLRGRLK
ncbi:hypothetical protein JR334_01870 [Clostridia bacterium]|nr:hypothetical protein JR334_01870 [Clostridia bacterium]